MHMNEITAKMSEDDQVAYVSANGRHIANIKNPSERVCLAAVRKCPHAISSINDQTFAVQLLAVKLAKTPYILRAINGVRYGHVIDCAKMNIYQRRDDFAWPEEHTELASEDQIDWYLANIDVCESTNRAAAARIAGKQVEEPNYSRYIPPKYILTKRSIPYFGTK